MKKQIRNTSLSILTMLTLTACAAAPLVVDNPAESKIKSIQTFVGGGSIRPELRKPTTTTLSRDLKLTKVVKDHKGAILSNTNIKITQAQFDNLVKEIDAVDLAQLRSQPSVMGFPSGARNKMVSIETNKDSYKFSNRNNYPVVISSLSNRIDKLFHSLK